jgi:hypothetical protein
MQVFVERERPVRFVFCFEGQDVRRRVNCVEASAESKCNGERDHGMWLATYRLVVLAD